MHPDRISLLVKKMRDQPLSAEELEELRSYLAQNTSDIDSLLSWSDWEDVSKESMTPDLRERVVTSVISDSQDARLIGRGGRRRRIRAFSLAAAAVVLCVIALPWWIQLPRDIGQPTNRTKTAARGQSRQVVLPDGSRVVLNGGSTITYPTVFADSDRQVALSGEAFFDVKTVSGRPFKVRTGQLLTTVLGTSFNVKAYGVDEEMTVAVKTGKVRLVAVDGLAATTHSCLLLPGQEGRYANDHHGIEVQTVDAGKVASWQDNELLFDGKTLREILTTLEIRYNVRFKPVASVALEKEYSVTFYHMNLQESLEKLSLLGSLEFEHRNDTLYSIK
jgi:transmembrane sensor